MLDKARRSPGLLKATCVAFISFASAAPCAIAQIPSWGVDSFHAPADSRWRSVTLQDVRAAYLLLRDNHPGAAAELHDLEFQKRLADSHELALRRARTVSSYEGYMATLAGFATGMGDKHIWSRPTFVVNLPRWAGMLVSKRGDTWIVSDAEESNKRLLGANLVGCDGVEVRALARKNLGAFRAVWSVGAQQIQSAPWLLVDEGNPFITRPKSCLFRHDGRDEAVSLEWTRIKRESLLGRLKKAVGAGAAGFGVRKAAQGFWIALQDLESDQARNVVKAVEEQKAMLREAAFVVLDLRGNGGGSSDMGRQIAKSLLGPAAVDERLGKSDENCEGADGAWRASEGNINNLQYLQTLPIVVQGSPEVQKIFSEVLQSARSARAQGKQFSASITCTPEPPPKPAATQVPSLFKGRLILLTDNLCFSSCLSVTEDFRALGALHVGETTDAATHFVEVREQFLPSGYSLFSTLQSVYASAPVQLGPYEPAIPYNGDISDTPALEEWVTRTIVGAAESNR